MTIIFGNIQGITGVQGVTGLQGITGLRGTTGIQGITGSSFSQTDIVNAAGTTTTTSATDVLVGSMTITPASGTYLVWFSSSGFPQTNNATQFVSIYSGGTQVTGSQRQMSSSGGATAAMNLGVASHARVTVNGSQAIEARWRVSAGTAQLNSRTLSILRVG